MIKASRTVVGAIGVCTLVVSGCTIKAGMLANTSHFVYPNSNVETLGEVSASKSKTGFFAAPTLNDADLEALYRSALAQKGGDILVNVDFETSMTSFVILPIISARYTISGTAAKMTVGTQKLANAQFENLRTLRSLADARGATAKSGR